MDPAQWTSALNNPEFKEPQMTVIEQLRWKKYPVLNDGHICLVDVMGNDAAIVQAARISFGDDLQGIDWLLGAIKEKFPNVTKYDMVDKGNTTGETTLFLIEENRRFAQPSQIKWEFHKRAETLRVETISNDRNLIRYLMRHYHTSPFEMVEFKFRVRVPMDCWRQWVRHRTANINEYSTRYREAIDSFQTTEPNEWRLQASSNKQGSEGFLEAYHPGTKSNIDGEFLSNTEQDFHEEARMIYQQRLDAGVAKEQARKDLPLSTYTEAYWKCDLHNIFNFLRLRMDSHAQYEIRMYANAMAEIVKQVVPIAWEAFEDYVLYAKRFSRMEMEMLREMYLQLQHYHKMHTRQPEQKPESMTQREWKEFLEKVA